MSPLRKNNRRLPGVLVMAWRRRKALGRWGVRSAPTGHRIPARGETPGMAHKWSVLKERRILPGALTCFAVAGCQGWRWGSVPRRGSAGTVLRSQGTWGQARLSRFRARGGSGCRRSYARFGPIPLPPVCAWVGWLRGVDAWGRSINVRSFGGRRFGCGGRRRTGPGGTWVVSESPD